MFASLHVPELSSPTYWQTLTFLKVSVFATFKTAPWLTSAMGHLHLPPTLQTRLCLLWGRSLTALPLKHRDGRAVTFSFEVWSLSKGLSTQDLALAALIYFPLFSFNSRDRHELILAMTPTSLEMSVSSNKPLLKELIRTYRKHSSDNKTLQYLTLNNFQIKLGKQI